jgi:hypothetical protein
VENKCRFFSWLLLQNRLWTSDRVIAHGGQGDRVCKLCYTHQESALHMLARCPYSRVVWQGLQQWIGSNILQPPRSSYRRFKSWWNSMMRWNEPGKAASVQKVVYTAWNLWKERCRHVFDNKGRAATNLQGLIVHDVAQWCTTWRCTAMTGGEPGWPPPPPVYHFPIFLDLSSFFFFSHFSIHL